jgi:hypothetical protein
MYKTKKKRVVDPNAPPRPNLLSHDKVIRDQKAMLDTMERQIAILKSRVESLESKALTQNNYLSTLHQHVARASKKG